jgi:DNA-binding transcriptional LysR family regulator
MGDTERWLAVPGYEGFYEVSDFGRVRSLRRGNSLRRAPKMLVGEAQRYGHIRVTLQRPGERPLHWQLHRLVLEAFVGSCPPEHECAHQDGDSKNNRLSNLRWMTHQENIHQREMHGTTAWGERGSNAKLTRSQVLEIRALYDAGATSQRALASRYGVCKTQIGNIVTAKNWSRLPEAA